MSDMPTTAATSAPFSGWRHSLAQNMSLLLSFVILGGLTLLYIGLFHGQLNAYPGIVRVDIGRQHRCPDSPRGGRPDDRRDHPWHRPFRRRRHRRLKRTRGHAHEGQPRQHGRLVARDPRSRRGLRRRQRDTRRLRPTPADPCHPGDARDPAGACDLDPPGARRVHPALLLERTRKHARTVEPSRSLHSWRSRGWSCDA